MDEHSNSQYVDESLSELEDAQQQSTMEVLFTELCNEWLEKNGMRILLQEVAHSKPKPKYKRQNAKSGSCFFSDNDK